MYYFQEMKIMRPTVKIMPETVNKEQQVPGRISMKKKKIKKVKKLVS